MSTSPISPAALLAWRLMRDGQADYDGHLPQIGHEATSTHRLAAVARQCRSWNGDGLEVQTLAKEIEEAAPDLEQFGIKTHFYNSEKEPVTRVRFSKEG